MSVHLFLLPHQDDEFAIFHLIERHIGSGDECWFVYLTNGAFGRATSAMRTAESVDVLSRFGVSLSRIVWLGNTLNVVVERAHLQLEKIFVELCRITDRIGTITSIYTPAWEGGHPDHDAAVLLAAALGRRINAAVIQFPLYNSYRCKLRPFRVLTPISEAGFVITERIPAMRWKSYIKYIAFYRSQLRTFVFIGPFILAHYITKGIQSVQPLIIESLFARPHSGKLLYERRKWLEFGDFEMEISSFRSAYISNIDNSS